MHYAIWWNYLKPLLEILWYQLFGLVINSGEIFLSLIYAYAYKD